MQDQVCETTDIVTIESNKGQESRITLKKMWATPFRVAGYWYRATLQRQEGKRGGKKRYHPADTEQTDRRAERDT